MKLFNLNRKTSLSRSVARLLIGSVYLTSCGGSTSESAATGAGSTNTATTPTNNTAAADSSSPAFDLKGFKFCGEQDYVLTLTVPTHVAFGLDKADRKDGAESKFVYLYAQTGKLKLSADVFGNDPIPPLYKKGYCKVVTADNNDAVVLSAAMAKIKAHLDGTSVMTAEQLQEQDDRITQTTYTLSENKGNITQAFALLNAYETKEKGAFFINAKTKEGFPNFSGKADNFGLDRAVLAIQQSIFEGSCMSSRP